MTSFRNRIVASFLALGFAASAAAPALAATNFKVDPIHTSLVFKIQHLGVSHSWGRINAPTGTVVVGDDGVPSINIEARAENVDTNNDQRDTHLKGPDFFDAKQFDTLSFKSTGGKKVDDGTFEVTGDFTLKGVTKPLTVTLKKVGEADTKVAGYRAGYDTSFTIKRSDYNMATMVGPVGDEVTIWVSIEGIRE
jgi:polyisoprenoid-binding protein YceI